MLSNIQVKKRDYLTISIVLVIVCICGLVFSLFLFQTIVDESLKWAMPLKPGAISRKFFLELPFPLEFHCHVFNITNPDAVQNGSKPILDDIGPYVFHEHIVKHDTVDDEENDTLTYTLKKTWIFKPELSNGLTGNELVTILHPVINLLALTVNVDRRGLLRTINDVVKTMYNPTTPYWTGKVMDLFFNGVEIDCTNNKVDAKSIVCALLKGGFSANVNPIPNKKDFLTFSILGPYNDTFNGRFKVYRGKKNVSDVARIVEIDGKNRMNRWLKKEENEYRGTDGYFTPPFMSLDKPIFAYERMICVSLGLEYERKQSIRGFPMPTFTRNFRHFAGDKAYCRKRKYGGRCPVEGTLDLMNCMGVPIVASLPHFLDADPSLLENIESGLTPNKHDHEIFASVDLETGIPFLGAKRLQLNFEVLPLKEVKVMKNLRKMIFPFVWIEERAKLPGLYITGLHCLFFTRLFVKLTKYLCMSVVPLAAIASLATHILIACDKIQTVESPPSSVKVVESPTSSVKVVEKAPDEVSNRSDDSELGTSEKNLFAYTA